MFFGFFLDHTHINEQIPAIFKYLSKSDRHRIFITQFNAVVERELRVQTKSLTKSENLLEIFTNKIDELVGEVGLETCDLSRYLIQMYKNNQTQEIRGLFAKTPSHPAAKLIQMIWGKENQGIYFESSWLFCNYVYEKISRCHQDKNVTYKDGIIIVSRGSENLIAVMPTFKYICMDKPHLADEEIRKAYKILESKDVNKFYIAYPKNDDFRKHIVVKYGENDMSSKLTLVPYAISHRLAYRKPNFK